MGAFRSSCVGHLRTRAAAQAHRVIRIGAFLNHRLAYENSDPTPGGGAVSRLEANQQAPPPAQILAE